MSDALQDLLSESDLSYIPVRRKVLLPWWMKAFMWIFLVFGVGAVFSIIAGILGYSFTIALYGISTSDPFSLAGLCLSVIYIQKAVTAWGMLLEKSWAMQSALIDAILGILVCCLVMGFELLNGGFSLRLELIILVFYLIKVDKIRRPWAAGLEKC